MVSLDKAIFSSPAVYRLKCFVIETIIWKWLLSGIFRLEQRPVPDELTVCEGKHVILAACGLGDESTGPSIESASSVVAFDMSHAFVSICKDHHPDWFVYRGDVLNLPHDDNAFDQAIIYSSLHHISEDATQVVLELSRVSRDKITVLESVIPSSGLLRYALLLWYKIVDGGHYYYTRRELEERFSELNITIEDMKFYSPISHMMLVTLDVSAHLPASSNHLQL